MHHLQGGHGRRRGREGEATPQGTAPASAAAAVTNVTPKKLSCGHIFHFRCLRSWLERQQSCPTCRRMILDDEPEVAPAQAQPPAAAQPIPHQPPPTAAAASNTADNSAGAIRVHTVATRHRSPPPHQLRLRIRTRTRDCKASSPDSSPTFEKLEKKATFPPANASTSTPASRRYTTSRSGNSTPRLGGGTASPMPTLSNSAGIFGTNSSINRAQQLNGGAYGRSNGYMPPHGLLSSNLGGGGQMKRGCKRCEWWIMDASSSVNAFCGGKEGLFHQRQRVDCWAY